MPCADIGERARLVHEALRRRHACGDIVAFDAGDLQAFDAELAGDLARAHRRGARIGGAHVADDGRARGAAGRQQRAHAALEMGVVAAARVGHAVAVSKGNRTLAEALEHHDIEFAAARKVDRRIEPVGGKSRAGADPEGVGFFRHAR